MCSSFAWAELVTEKGHTVSARNTSRFARRVACELKPAGWTLERFLGDNANEFKGEFSALTTELGAAHTRIHAGRPRTNGHVEALHKTILDECWRPAFARYLYPTLTGLRRELDTYLTYYNTDRVQPRPTHPRTHPRRHHPQSPKDGAPMSPTSRHISESAHSKRSAGTGV